MKLRNRKKHTGDVTLVPPLQLAIIASPPTTIKSYDTSLTTSQLRVKLVE